MGNNWFVARRKISETAGMDALREVRSGSAPRVASNPHFATAVRFLLEELSVRIPGNSVEVRVPPLMAVQCVAGPAHRRGTPANVVEISPELWFALAVGETSIDEVLADEALAPQLLASGTRALEFANVLPLIRQ